MQHGKTFRMNFLIKSQAVQEILIIRLQEVNEERRQQFVLKQRVCSLVLEKRLEKN